MYILKQVWTHVSVLLVNSFSIIVLISQPTILIQILINKAPNNIKSDVAADVLVNFRSVSGCCIRCIILCMSNFKVVSNPVY